MLCSSCGQENSIDAKVCAYCGQPIAAGNDTGADPSKTAPSGPDLSKTSSPGPNLGKPDTAGESATVPYAEAAQYVPPYQAPGQQPGQPPYWQGNVPSYVAPGMQPPLGVIKPMRDYMNWSIITLIVSIISCNVLAAGFAIPAIVFSSQGRDSDARGDVYSAYSAKKNAQIFFWISFGICAMLLLFWLLYFGIFIIAFLGIGISSIYGY